MEEQGQTHEKALRTPNCTLFEEKCKMKPPETRRETSWETRPREGRDTPSNKRKHEARRWETRVRHDLEKADAPSNTGEDSLAHMKVTHLRTGCQTHLRTGNETHPHRIQTQGEQGGNRGTGEQRNRGGKVLHTEASTHSKLLHTEAFTHTQKLLHTATLRHQEACAHSKLLHTEPDTHRRFYTQKLLHTRAVLQRRFDTRKLAHIAPMLSAKTPLTQTCYLKQKLLMLVILMIMSMMMMMMMMNMNEGASRAQASLAIRCTSEPKSRAHTRRLSMNHLTQAYMWGANGNNGRQGETRRREGGHTIQHRHTCGETIGDKRRQWETRPREGGHTIQHTHTCGTTMGDKGR